MKSGSYFTDDENNRHLIRRGCGAQNSLQTALINLLHLILLKKLPYDGLPPSLRETVITNLADSSPESRRFRF